MQINELTGLGGKTCLEYIDLPESPERMEPTPETIINGPAGNIINHHTGSNMAWRHQAIALQSLLQNQNVVIATGTASGKSLIFQSWTFHGLKNNPNATTIVFDPLRALAEDQMQSWKQLAQTVGISPEAVVKIDGSIPIAQRETLLKNASIAIMTPDVCHAWMMRNMSSRIIQEFIGNLTTLILDEAHVYDSVFGSNAAYLFRRLLTAQKQMSNGRQDCQIIAATATISNAGQHLTNLTGRPFTEITEAENGAPIYPRRLMHIDGSYENDLLPIIEHALTLDEKFIVFADSRQGVERIARQIGRPNQVAAYRNGYESEDRRKIETALRDSELKGVISTSALELGINIPGLTLGVNFRIPNTRKSFRQRLGRIGRHGPGIFVVVADRTTFREFGDTLKSYYESSVEPSVLYLDNHYVQFVNAQCLAKETGIKALEDNAVEWPEGFLKMTEFALKGNWPKQYEILGRSGRRHPHINNPLRSIADDELTLIRADDGRKLGSIKLSHALREAYPMGSYIHQSRTYQAGHWNREGEYGKTEIPLIEVPFHQKTEPVISMEIKVKGVVNKNVAIHSDPEKGYIAEVHATVTERTIGCSNGSTQEIYAIDEQPIRIFDTTGVLIRIEEPWAQWLPPRQNMGYTLKRFTCYDQSIATWDIQHSEEPINISSKKNPDGQFIPNALIIFDTTNGSLRLTQALFQNITDYTSRLQRAVELEGETIDQDMVTKLSEWVKGLQWPENDQPALADNVTTPSQA